MAMLPLLDRGIDSTVTQTSRESADKVAGCFFISVVDRYVLYWRSVLCFQTDSLNVFLADLWSVHLAVYESVVRRNADKLQCNSLRSAKYCFSESL